MIQKILIGFVIATVLILLVLWLVTGGPGKVINYAKKIGNPIEYIFASGTSTGGFFTLPWQPDISIGGFYEIPDSDSTSGAGTSGGEGDSLTTEEELAQMQKKYDALIKETDAARTFGTPSPQRGKVHLGAGGAESEAGKEYLELEADWGNSSPISISSWSLQSALTGVRAYIPRGANLFGLGYINEESDVYLNPGATAIVSSIFSPVGTSFRENICIGYLGRLQTFVPRLSSNCPLPSESLPLTPDNLQTYGDACFDFVQTLPSCALPRETPPEVSSECRIFLSNTISYNGCVEQYRHRSDFLRAAWRIYLGADGELWRNTHDVIRLLDSEGRTVDVVSY